MKIELKKPENNQTVQLLPEEQRQLRSGVPVSGETNEVNWRSPALDGTERSYPLKVHFAWKSEGTDGCMEKAHLFTRMDREDEIVLDGDHGQAEVENLFIGQRYYWLVTAENEAHTVCSSPIFCFDTDAAAPRLIHAEGLTNVRDLGGWVTKDGRVMRQGLFFRGSEMDDHHRLQPEGKKVLLETLKIKTDMDLRRGVNERLTESPMGKEVDWLYAPLRPYEEFLAENMWENIRFIFDKLCDRSIYPVYCHCWGGADRTGILAMSICAIMGVPDEQLLQDYELTSFSIYGKRMRTAPYFVPFPEGLKEYGIEEVGLGESIKRFLLHIGVTREQFDILRDIFLG